MTFREKGIAPACMSLIQHALAQHRGMRDDALLLMCYFQPCCLASVQCRGWGLHTERPHWRLCMGGVGCCTEQHIMTVE